MLFLIFLLYVISLDALYLQNTSCYHITVTASQIADNYHISKAC